MIHSRQPTSLVISRHYCLISFHSKMNCIKKFSRIVCVSLFSYQGYSLSALCDSLFRLSHLEDLVKNFFQKFFEVFSKGSHRRHFSYLFRRLDYFTISSVDCQQLIWIFWKRISFSVFQKQFLATACLLYHCRKEKSSTFCKKL